MSHFIVMVVGDDFEKQLQPYHEYECTGINDEYVVFVDETEEKEKEYKTGTKTMLINFDGETKCPYSDEFYREPTKDELNIIGPAAGSGVGGGLSWSSKDWHDGLGYRAKIRFIPDDYMKKEIPLKNIYPTLRKYLEEYDGYSSENFQEGKIGRFTNPNSKWDWFQLGGRWRGSLILKKISLNYPDHVLSEKGWSSPDAENGKADQTLKKYIDIEAMEKPMIDKSTKQWDEWNSGIKDLSDDNKDKSDWIKENLGWLAQKQELDRLNTMSRDEYIACKSIWHTYAVLWDGNWYEKGKMGWFGMSMNEENNWKGQFKELWNEIPDESIITMVDCHI